eukprot:2919043-Rhodomonas_salina.3
MANLPQFWPSVYGTAKRVIASCPSSSKMRQITVRVAHRLARQDRAAKQEREREHRDSESASESQEPTSYRKRRARAPRNHRERARERERESGDLRWVLFAHVEERARRDERPEGVERAHKLAPHRQTNRRTNRRGRGRRRRCTHRHNRRRTHRHRRRHKTQAKSEPLALAVSDFRRPAQNTALQCGATRCVASTRPRGKVQAASLPDIPASAQQVVVEPTWVGMPWDEGVECTCQG